MPVCLETLLSLCSYVLMFLWFRVSGDALTELGNHILYYCCPLKFQSVYLCFGVLPGQQYFLIAQFVCTLHYLSALR